MNKKDDPEHADANDNALFHAAMQDVAPLAKPDKVILKQQKPEPRPSLQKQHSEAIPFSDAFSPEIGLGDELSFSRPGVSRQTLRRLKRGYWKIQDSLDLHGCTQEAARQLLADFLNNAQESNFRCIKIIHGKGLSSKDRIPVLKNSVGNWLAQREAVLAYCQARLEDGGGGAVLVLLKG